MPSFHVLTIVWHNPQQKQNVYYLKNHYITIKLDLLTNIKLDVRNPFYIEQQLYDYWQTFNRFRPWSIQKKYATEIKTMTLRNVLPFTRTFTVGVCIAHLFSFSFSLLCFCLFVFFLCVAFPMLHVSLNCPFFVAPSVFSNIYLHLISTYSPV